RDQRTGLEEAHHRRDGEVEQRHAVGDAVDPGVVGGGEMRQGGRHGDAAGAHAERVDVVAAGDVAGDVDGPQVGPGVRVEPPVAVLLAGVAPADGEELDAAADGVLDEAPPRGQVEEVVLVDLRRDHDHRPALHPGGRGGELEDLHH